MDEATVRDLVIDYLAGAISLIDLDRRLSVVSWDVDAQVLLVPSQTQSLSALMSTPLRRAMNLS